MPKKENQGKPDEGGGILIPVLVAAMVCVVLTTTFIVGYGLQYTAEQRAIEAQQSGSVAPARSIPSPSESPVQNISAPPEESEPQRVEDTAPEESEPEEGSQPVSPLPSASPPASAAPSVSLSPSSTPPASPSPTPSAKPPESQAPASPVQSNTPQTPAGNDRESKFASGQVLATTKSNNGGDPVYHTWNCRAAKKIAEESELWYESEQAAKADGRDWCGICSKQ